ncbi:NVEALA domain-containing protein [Capnocytophaga canis]|uniref:NVEALA domain-containing protein n=1 Tax=Capnocytophaga canis TaxID=1848903 RepID=UPI0037D53AF3
MKSLLVIGIVATGGYGINQSVNKDTTELNELTLANIEALAQNENGGGSADSWSCWSNLKSGNGVWVCGNPCFFKDNAQGKGSADSICYRDY